MVTAYKNIGSTKKTYLLNVEEAIDKIIYPGEKMIFKIEIIRSEKDKKKRDKLKKNMLPVISWSGIFAERSNSAFIKPSGYLYIDIDKPNVKKSDVFKLSAVKAVWNSCSLRGLGCIVRVEGINSKNYRPTYLQVKEYFKNNGIEIDHLPDISRANYISYDSNVLIREEPSIIDSVDEIELNQSIHHVLERINEITACTVSISYTKKKYSFMEGQRSNFSVTYFGLCNMFGVPMNEAYGFAQEHMCIFEDSWKIVNYVYKRYAGQHGTKSVYKN